MEQRFGYGLEELARRFDRSVSWVSRRLALVELLPEAVQQLVREGKVAAQVAMKHLVPVARISLEDCQRMAAAFAQHHCNTREAGQLYAAWRSGSRSVRERLLASPELFFKTQRRAPVGETTQSAALERDLEMAAAVLRRARRRLTEALPEMAPAQQHNAECQIASARRELERMAEQMGKRRQPGMLTQAQRTTIWELHTQGVSKHEIARVLGISRPSVRKVLRSQTTEVPEIHRAEKAEPYRQRILDLFSTCKGNLVRVHEELLAGGAAMSYQALTAFCRRHGIGQTPTMPAGRYDFEPGE